MARPKAALAAAGLTDGEFWRRPRWRRLPFGTRQRRTDQWTMNGAFFDVRFTLRVFGVIDFARFAVRSGGVFDRA
jgi:hypothetical protein